MFFANAPSSSSVLLGPPTRARRAEYELPVQGLLGYASLPQCLDFCLTCTVAKTTETCIPDLAVLKIHPSAAVRCLVRACFLRARRTFRSPSRASITRPSMPDSASCDSRWLSLGSDRASAKMLATCGRETGCVLTPWSNGEACNARHHHENTEQAPRHWHG